MFSSTMLNIIQLENMSDLSMSKVIYSSKHEQLLDP